MLFYVEEHKIPIYEDNHHFLAERFANLKKSRTFAPLSTESTSEKKFWRGGRVVDCGGLENR